MDVLVSSDWLAERLGDADILVLDASKHLPGANRDAREEFAAAHIPGARFFDLATMIDETSDVPKALPRADQVTERMQTLGARRGQHVLLYDDSEIRTSARAWFILRRHGVTRVSILDGGLAKWRAERRPLERGISDCARGDFTASPGTGAVRTKDEMLANIALGVEQVLDARDAARFAGTAQSDPHGQQGGHIPGSRNLPYGRLFAEDGTVLSEADLRREFQAVGIDLGAPVVTTCGSGVTASVLLLAMARLGKEDAALYDGSWLEWGGDPGTPKEFGAAL